jgi:UV DNA damage repair endonuclease
MSSLGAVDCFRIEDDSWEALYFNLPDDDQHLHDCNAQAQYRCCSCLYKRLGTRNLKKFECDLKTQTTDMNIVQIPPSLFPFAADLYRGYSVQFAQKRLERIGKFVKCHQKYLVHVVPSETSVLLGSSCIHERTIGLRYLDYCIRVLESMRIPDHGYIVLHIKHANEKFFRRICQTICPLRHRIDKRIAFTTSSRDSLICREENIPLVWDATDPINYPRPCDRSFMDELATTWHHDNDRVDCTLTRPFILTFYNDHSESLSDIDSVYNVIRIPPNNKIIKVLDDIP